MIKMDQALMPEKKRDVFDPLSHSGKNIGQASAATVQDKPVQKANDKFDLDKVQPVKLK